MADQPLILIVEGRFYEDIADQLAKGAIQVLDEAGVPYKRLAVPGAFEIPATIRYAIRAMEVGSASVHYSGFIALGCVIRGDTTHYDYVCAESARALMNLTMTYSIALGFGILTCETHDQASVRAAIEQKNKGGEVARACLRMMEVKKGLRLGVQ